MSREGTPARQGREDVNDPNTSGKDKAIEGAAAAATAIGSAVGSPVVGKVAGAMVKSKSGRKVLGVLAGVVVVLLASVLILVASVVQAASMVLVTTSDPAPATVATNPCVTLGSDPTLTGDQQANAAAIISTTMNTRSLSANDAVIAIMTALTESGLTNVNHGDLAGPDSIGLFQQRNSWGPLAVRTDPAGSTGLFLDHLTAPGLRLFGTSTLINGVGDTGRRAVAPWMVAESVQISAFSDGSKYKAQYARAVAIVTAIAGAGVAGSVDSARWSTGTIAAPVLVPVGATGSPTTSAPATATDLSGCGSPTGAGGAWGGFENGKIPLTSLCPIPWAPTRLLRCDAEKSLESMSSAFKAAFGTDLGISDAYRSYDQQVAIKAIKGAFAATPGTSNHGWGVAVDFGTGIATWGSPQRAWMVANAPVFGWQSPNWAQQGQPTPEPWHWEFQMKAGT